MHWARLRRSAPTCRAPRPRLLACRCSCVGLWQHDRVEIIPNEQGNRTTPSYVAFTDSERLIGDDAKNQVAMNPINTVFDAKRLIGRKFTDATIQHDISHWPFKVVSGAGDKPMIQGERALRRPRLGCSVRGGDMHPPTGACACALKPPLRQNLGCSGLQGRG